MSIIRTNNIDLKSMCLQGLYEFSIGVQKLIPKAIRRNEAQMAYHQSLVRRLEAGEYVDFEQLPPVMEQITICRKDHPLIKKIAYIHVNDWVEERMIHETSTIEEIESVVLHELMDYYHILEKEDIGNMCIEGCECDPKDYVKID